MEGIYILHFSQKVDNNYMGGPWHYVGYSSDIERRVGRHLRGQGSKKTKAALKQGVKITHTGSIEYYYPRPEGRDRRKAVIPYEGEISKEAKKHCSICKAKKLPMKK